jgi:hypothetical protein
VQLLRVEPLPISSEDIRDASRSSGPIDGSFRPAVAE